MDLTKLAVLLAALALAGPLARWLGVAAVLGYLLAGVLLGPYTFGWVFTAHDATEILHYAEFGVILLLFLIGLELKPKRVMAMRTAVFGLGAKQFGISALALGSIALMFDLPWQAALFAGAALALSSTPLALQVLEESGDLNQRHGRLGFAVLLFQDMAAIPLIALAPFLSVSVADTAGSIDFSAFGLALLTVIGVIVGGYYFLDSALRLVARSKVKEAMTAAALLTVVGVSVVMAQVGLSAALGAFIAGVLLSESSYRHQIYADLEPFEGLLLGIFFTAIGMSLNLSLLWSDTFSVLLVTALLMVTKGVVLFVLGRREGLENFAARRFALALAHGGEFAFVLLSIGSNAGVVGKESAELLAVAVTLSIAITPLLLMAEKFVFPRREGRAQRAFDDLPDQDQHVIIAGFGRYGQIVARVLRAKSIPFTALEVSVDQIDFVSRYGSKVFFGDASRPDILAAAQVEKAKAFVLAIDDVEASLRTAEIVSQNYPHVPIYARARNRAHAHRLLDLGVNMIQRETFLSALETTRHLLKGLGYSERVADRSIATFKTHDQRRLLEDYQHYSDDKKMRERALENASTLEKLFQEDAEEEARLVEAESEHQKTG